MGEFKTEFDYNSDRIDDKISYKSFDAFEELQEFVYNNLRESKVINIQFNNREWILIYWHGKFDCLIKGNKK